MLANWCGDQPTDRRVPDHKPVPFPRHWLQAEQMADGHGIRATMGDPSDTPTRGFDIPDWQIRGHAGDAMRGQQLGETAMNSIGEVAHRLATRDAVPSILRSLKPIRGISPLRNFSWFAMPIWLATFLEPMHNLGLTA